MITLNTIKCPKCNTYNLYSKKNERGDASFESYIHCKKCDEWVGEITFENTLSFHGNYSSKFHLRDIKKGILGKSSKIYEELSEYDDSMERGIKIMAHLELSDIYGALESLAETHNLSMEDLKKMSDVRKDVFRKESNNNGLD